MDLDGSLGDSAIPYSIFIGGQLVMQLWNWLLPRSSAGA